MHACSHCLCACMTSIFLSIPVTRVIFSNRSQSNWHHQVLYGLLMTSWMNFIDGRGAKDEGITGNSQAQLAWHTQWQLMRDPFSRWKRDKDQYLKLSSALHICTEMYAHLLLHTCMCIHTQIFFKGGCHWLWQLHLLSRTKKAQPRPNVEQTV